MAAGVYHLVTHSNGSTSPDGSTFAVGSSVSFPAAVAIQMESPNEKTPLIRKKVAFAEERAPSKCSVLLDCRALLIALLLVIGFTIATYLLIIDTQLPPIRYAVDLIGREIWSSVPYVYASKRVTDALNVTHVLLTQTGGEDCSDMESCVSLLRQLEESHKNNGVPYNFLVGGDGEIYEGRGWNQLSGFPVVPQETSLVIALIGDFTQYVPPLDQLTAAKALIKESLKRGKVRDDFQLYGMQNLTISQNDGLALYESVSQWPHFNAILKVL